MKKSFTCLSILFLSFFANFSFAQLTGNIYLDANNNGIKEVSETGEVNITVKVYNASDMLVNTASSVAGGTYNLTGLAANTAYRVEFTFTSAQTAIGYMGSVAGGTSTQFITTNSSGAGIANFGYTTNYSRTHMCSGGFAPRVASNMFVRGLNNVFPGVYVSSWDNATDRSFSVSGTTPQPIALREQILATHSQVGAVWGMAASVQRQQFFMSSFTRRHSGWGPGNLSGAAAKFGSPGAIYRVNMDGTGLTVLLDLPLTDVIGSTNPRTSVSNDTLFLDPIWHQVGRSSWGDIDIDESGQILYAMNMYNRSLYKINAGTGDVLGIYPIPGITGGPAWDCLQTTQEDEQLRPMAIGINKGKVYIGVINSEEKEQNRDDLRAYVFEFNPITNTYNTTPVLEAPLGSGPGTGAGTPIGNGFEVWQDTDLPIANPRRMPKFNDIEFVNDNMTILIGPLFFDLVTSHPGDTKPDGTSFGGSIYQIYSGAFSTSKLLNATPNGSNWDLETGFPANYLNTPAPGSGDGSTTFYQQMASHAGGELTGGLAYNPCEGGGRLAIAGFPGADVGGLMYINTASPATPYSLSDVNTIQYHYSPNAINLPPNEKTYFDGAHVWEHQFGKIGSMGDVELIFDNPHIEIGNRVWNDADGDGIQDADEAGMEGVEVELLNSFGVVIGTVITDVSGNYYFSSGAGTNTAGITYGINILPDTNYTIRIKGIVNANGTISGNAGLSGSNYITHSNINGNGEVDYSDNDGVIVGNAGGVFETALTTGNYGQNNHSVDFGFSPLYVLPVKITSLFAIPQNKKTTIIWNVAEQSGIDKYEVEFSTDGQLFSPLQTIQASANSSEHYQYIHLNPKYTIGYYRIKIIELSGKVFYSEIVKVRLNKTNSSITASPNPAKDKIKISVEGDLVNKKAIVYIFDLEGKIYFQNTITALAPINSLTLPGLPTGKYILQIVTNTEKISQKIMIAN